MGLPVTAQLLLGLQGVLLRYEEIVLLLRMFFRLLGQITVYIGGFSGARRTKDESVHSLFPVPDCILFPI